MTRISENLTADYHEPRRNKPCVCGSGLKFKRCCVGAYSSKSSELFQSAYNSGDYKKALIYARNHFTWYALSHKAHTIPLLKANQAVGENLLHIDIDALAELLDNLHLCYYHLGRGKEFLEVVERVRGVIVDRRWDDKIAYARSLSYLIDWHDSDAAFTALRTIDIDACYDSDILSLYLDVCPTGLTFMESIEIIDRIIDNTQKESIRLQYRVLKAIKYYLACQQKDAKKLFNEAISCFSDLPDENKSSYGKLQFAYALEIYGKSENSKSILKQGREIVSALIHEADKEQYTEGYVADLYKLLGDFEDSLGNYHDAIEAYSLSMEKNQSQLTKVFLARSICNNGDNNRARELLGSINDKYLKESERFDLAISWAILAVKSLRSNDIMESKKRLKAVVTHDPLFIQLRDSWIIDLLEIKSKSEPGRILSFIRSLNKYVVLAPNVFGVGININRIIDDVESATKK